MRQTRALDSGTWQRSAGTAKGRPHRFAQEAVRSRPAGDSARFFPCPYEGCAKTIRRRRDIVIHLRTHTQERPYPCTVEGCNKAFLQSAHRYTHLRTHCREKAYSCPVEGCDRKLASKGSLQKHGLLHSTDKSIPCTAANCDKKFRTGASLHAHLLQHSGERIWICPRETCGKRFARKMHLNAHLLCHAPEKPWSCSRDGCGKRFVRKAQLTAHLQLHSGNRTWPCPFEGCPSRFVRKDGAQRHFQVQHEKKKKILPCLHPDCQQWFAHPVARNCHYRLHTAAELTASPFSFWVKNLARQYQLKCKTRAHSLPPAAQPLAAVVPSALPTSAPRPPAKADSLVPLSSPGGAAVVITDPSLHPRGCPDPTEPHHRQRAAACSHATLSLASRQEKQPACALADMPGMEQMLPAFPSLPGSPDREAQSLTDSVVDWLAQQQRAEAGDWLPACGLEADTSFGAWLEPLVDSTQVPAPFMPAAKDTEDRLLW